MYFERQEALLFTRARAGEFLSEYEEQQKRKTRKILDALDNPPPNIPEYIAEAGSVLLERWKEKTRKSIEKSLGVELRTPRSGEKDGIVYPPHILFLSAVVRPFVAYVSGRRTKIVKMLLGSGMDAEDLQLYRSMSLRERKIEDGLPPCPTLLPPYGFRQ
ncbi:hypothetical protein K2X83_01770 [Patescibacteria group bacterium]|nr:hypothetical protein [Patescibacteria group bacterium]